VNNFIGAQPKMRVANSASPSGGSKSSSKTAKLKKGIKVVSNTGKSPYMNNHFIQGVSG
jgi:hypothetical protein